MRDQQPSKQSNMISIKCEKQSLANLTPAKHEEESLAILDQARLSGWYLSFQEKYVYGIRWI